LGFVVLSVLLSGWYEPILIENVTFYLFLFYTPKLAVPLVLGSLYLYSINKLVVRLSIIF